jgi:hypothetical protein
MSKKSFLMCGNEAIEWKVLGDFFSCLSRYILTLDVAFDKVAFNSIKNILLMSELINRLNSQNGLDTHQLLHLPRSFDCPDPMDHLIAIIGPSNQDTSDSLLLPYYQTNANKSFSQVRNMETINHQIT